MNDKKIDLKYIVTGLIFTVLLIVLDQVTKGWAVTNLKDQANIVLIPGAFELSYLENRGAAFGLMQNQTWLFIIGVVFVLILASYCYLRLPRDKRYRPLRWLCIGMAAGAIGNVIDRLTNGFVVDFFYFSLIDFPVFNFADIYLTVSAFLLILLVIFYYKDEDFAFLSRKKKQES